MPGKSVRTTTCTAADKLCQQEGELYLRWFSAATATDDDAATTTVAAAAANVALLPFISESVKPIPDT